MPPASENGGPPMSARFLRELRTEVEQVERSREQLQRALRAMDKRRDLLMELLAHYETESVGTPAEETRAADMPAKLVRNAAVEVLRDSGPLHYKMILVRLEERGISVNGKDPARNLNAHLSNDERFVSLGEGRWTLTARNVKPVSIASALTSTGTEDEPLAVRRRIPPPLPRRVEDLRQTNGQADGVNP